MRKKHHEIPETLKNPQKWAIQRRGFLKLMLGSAVASQIPWWVACQSDRESPDDFIMNENQRDLLKEVQSFLFPSDGNGPGANELNALDYLQWVLLDPNMDPEEKKYLLKGISWVEETAREERNTSFLNLEEEAKENLLEAIASEDWGEAWYSMNLTFIFEALLSDPIYGSNRDGMAWKWLEHNPGYPRPTEEMKYGNFLSYIHQQNKG